MHGNRLSARGGATFAAPHPNARRASIALSLCAAIAMGAVIAPAAAQASSLDTVVSDFENGALWSFANGAEFPGAAGGVAIDSDARSGSSAIRLSADFTAGGKYVAMSKASSVDLEKLSFWVKSETGTRLALRLVDTSGQTHQQRIALTPGTAWQEIIVTDFTGGTAYTHFGGANDGVWHGPLKSISIIADENSFGGAKTGSILVDDVIASAVPSALALEQVADGNIFVDGETAAIDIQSSGDEVAWALTGLDGGTVDSGTLAMNESVERLSFPDLDLGYYTLSTTAVAGGETIGTAKTVLALLVDHDEPTDDSPFGMAAHLTRWEQSDYDIIGLLEKAGTAHTRGDSTWGSVELTKGQYTYDRYEAMYEVLEPTGIDWLTVPSYTNPFYDGNATPYSDEGREGYANFAVAFTEHYGSSHVEVYNEFNHTTFGDRGDGPADAKAEYYFPLLKKTYEELKAANSDTVVVGGATAGVPLAWLETLFQLGGLQYMDALSIHPYLYPGSPGGLDTLIDQVNALVKRYNNGQTIPIWITEQGWITGTNARAVTEQTQADYIVQTHVRALSKGVERFFWYDFMNDGTDAANNENNFGVIRNTADALGRWTPKPSYVAYSTMTAELHSAGFDRIETLANGVSDYVFTEDGEEKRVIWSTTPTSAALAASGPVTITDQQGRQTQLTPVGGTVEFTATASPVFVEGAVTGPASARLSLELPSSVAIDDAFTATVGVDNKAGSDPVTGDLVLDGETVTVAVPAGSTAEYELTLQAGREIGTRTLRGALIVDGATAATVTGSVEVRNHVAVSARHAQRESGEVVEVTVSNASVEALPAHELSWRVGETSGTTAVPEVPAAGSAVVDVELDALPPGSYATTVAYRAEGLPAAESKTTTVIVDPMTQRTIVHTTDADSATALDLTVDGTNSVTGWTGEEDLSGTIVPTWDEEGLHLQATIVDDVQAQPNSGEQIWAGDSIQFTVQAGTPGETKPWDELGIALTAEGPTVWKWVAGSGDTGEVADARASVVRDEAEKTTTYDLTLPWSSISPTDASTRLLSLSFAINDDDGAGRTGWIEVGSGIAKAKDNTLFLPFVLGAAPEGAVCDTVVDQDVSGALTLDEGVTCVTGITVKGPITVTHGASLQLTDSTVKGAVYASSAGAVTISGSDIRGAVSVQRASDAVLIDTTRITGIASVTGNTGGVTVSGNTISGVLVCSGNDPAPVNAGVKNTVKGLATGQCAGL